MRWTSASSKGRLFLESQNGMNPNHWLEKKLPFIVNLEPRNFKGVESQGMLMAVDGENGPVFLEPSGEVKVGDKVI